MVDHFNLSVPKVGAKSRKGFYFFPKMKENDNLEMATVSKLTKQAQIGDMGSIRQRTNAVWHDSKK